MNSDEYMLIVPRFSTFKKGIELANTVAIIDSDFHDEILIIVRNITRETIKLKKNDRIIQGIFMKYLLDEYEKPIKSTRIGGLGFWIFSSPVYKIVFHGS